MLEIIALVLGVGIIIIASCIITWWIYADYFIGGGEAQAPIAGWAPFEQGGVIPDEEEVEVARAAGESRAADISESAIKAKDKKSEEEPQSPRQKEHLGDLTEDRDEPIRRRMRDQLRDIEAEFGDAGEELNYMIQAQAHDKAVSEWKYVERDVQEARKFLKKQRETQDEFDDFFHEWNGLLKEIKAEMEENEILSDEDDTEGEYSRLFESKTIEEQWEEMLQEVRSK